MPVIPQKELRNNVGEVLRRAEAGEEFTVTVAGRPVARLGPGGGRGRGARPGVSRGWGGAGSPDRIFSACGGRPRPRRSTRSCRRSVRILAIRLRSAASARHFGA